MIDIVTSSLRGAVFATICFAFFFALFVVVFIFPLWAYFAISERMTKRRAVRDGYWVQYIFDQREPTDDFAIIYHEGKNHQGFTGKIHPSPRGKELLMVEERLWEKGMPDWLKGRRQVVVERIQRKFKNVQIVTRIVAD